MTACLRCTKCCYYLIPDKDGVVRLKKCKHLRRNFELKNGICRVYNKRKLLRFHNGIVIDTYKDKEGNKQNVWCVWRENSEFNYEGCPFNVEGKKDFAEHCEEHDIKFEEWKR